MQFVQSGMHGMLAFEQEHRCVMLYYYLYSASHRRPFSSGPIDHPGIIAICLPCLVGLHNSPRQRSAGKADRPAAEGGFLPAQDRSFGDLAVEADRKLFRAVVTDPRHVLSRLLPEVKSTSYNLRPRAHCFVLPTKDTRNFIPRMLYEKIYCKIGRA